MRPILSQSSEHRLRIGANLKNAANNLETALAVALNGQADPELFAQIAPLEALRLMLNEFRFNLPWSQNRPASELTTRVRIVHWKKGLE